MKNFTKQITNKTLFKPTRWLLMALMLLIGTGSAWGKTIYFKPNSNWTTDNARFAAYFYGNGDEWKSMSVSSTRSGYYEVEVPCDKHNVIFCRMNGGNSTNDWNNKWNQTGDLTYYAHKGDTYTQKDGEWGGGNEDARWTCHSGDCQIITPLEEYNYDLGDVGLGDSKTIKFEFKYIGTSPTYNPKLLNVGDGFTYEITREDCVTTYEITFKPTSLGEKTGTIYIEYPNGVYQQQISATGIDACTRPVIVTNSATYNQSTGLVDITYSISETGGATTHYGIQYRADGSPFPTEDLTDADFIKIGTTSNTVTNATYTYQTVLTPGTYYFRTYANNGCPAFDYSVGMVYGEEIQVVVPKKDQPTLTLTGVATTYCTVPNEPITLSTDGGDGEGTVSYQIVNDGTTADASIANTNQLTITSAGTLKLKAIKAADTNFKQAESAVVTVTIYADIEAGSISPSTTTVCQGSEVTLTLNDYSDGVNFQWQVNPNTGIWNNVQGATERTVAVTPSAQTTYYRVEVTRTDGDCPKKTKYANATVTLNETSALRLSSSAQTACIGTNINLADQVDTNTGTVTWYSDANCTQQVADASNVTINSTATYYAKAKNGVCPATEAAAYAITAKGVSISQNPATVHPYEVTTFTATKTASWELTTNPSSGTALPNDDPTFSGKTTAYITKADDDFTTFKGEKAATGYVIKATADNCVTSHTFNVVDDPNNCQQ